MMKQNILVTGIAGFIGSAVANELLTKGYNVVGVDNLYTGKLENVPSGVDFIELDASSFELEKHLKKYKFKAILHIAGQSSADISYSDPIYDLNANVTSTLNLLQLAVKTGVQKFIFASSATVYGHQDEPLLLNEDQTAMPISFYAIGKLASEQYLKLFSREYGISTTSFRLFNVYGPGQNLDNFNQGMASIYLAQALKNKKIHVKGSGDRFRDFVYIDDVVQVFIDSLQTTRKREHIINVCTGNAITVNYVCDFIGSHLNLSEPTQFSGSTRGDIHGQTGDPSRLLENTNMNSLTLFDEGMLKMIQWAENQKRW